MDLSFLLSPGLPQQNDHLKPTVTFPVQFKYIGAIKLNII